MSLARAHRESFLAAQSETAVAPAETGGHLERAPVEGGRSSLARDHRDRTLAATAALAAQAAHDTTALDAGTPEQRASAQMEMRLQHDLRRLHDIKSVSKKIEAKREMLPHYAAWVDGLVAAGVGIVEEVLPTVMVWRIDVGDFEGALALAQHMLAHGVPIPARYKRDAVSVIAEEIADAALKVQGPGAGTFPLSILTRVDELTAQSDMHDQIRAKLAKAIGVEQMRASDDDKLEPLVRAAAAATALATLRRAHGFNERVGVKDRIKRLEKLLVPPQETPNA